ncbi:MAG: ABC transporter permease [Bacteroidota bacterium]
MVRSLLGRPTNVFASIVLFFLILMSFCPALFTKDDPYALKPMERLQAPSFEHWLGTDENGRNIFTRIVYGTRTTVGLTLLSIILSLVLGVTVGLLAGYLGGIVEEVLMRFADIMLAFPQLILSMAIVAALGQSMTNAMIGISLAWWAQYARIMNAEVKVIKNQPYVSASVALGRHPIWILTRHIFMNAFTPVMVKAILDIGLIMLNLAALSFIGLGAKPPMPEWGAMIAWGRQYLLEYWWIPTFPGLAIFITVMSFNFLGDWVRDILDPRSKMEAK